MKEEETLCGGNLTGFDDRYMGLLSVLTKQQESVTGSQAQHTRGRELHIIGSKTAKQSR